MLELEVNLIPRFRDESPVKSRRAFYSRYVIVDLNADGGDRSRVSFEIESQARPGRLLADIG